MILLTIISAGRWPRRAKPVPQNILLKIYFKQCILNNKLFNIDNETLSHYRY